MSVDNIIKSEQVLSLDQELDLHNCIEEFDLPIIYQIPEEFASDFCDGDSNQNLTSEFTFNIGDDGDRGWVESVPTVIILERPRISSLLGWKFQKVIFVSWD